MKHKQLGSYKQIVTLARTIPKLSQLVDTYDTIRETKGSVKTIVEKIILELNK